MSEAKPVFPITVSWVEDGEIEVFKDLKEMECALEWFDSSDPKQGATVTDKLGRRVRLKIGKLQTVDFAIAAEETVEIPPKIQKIIDRLMAERIVFIGTPIDDTIAGMVNDYLRTLAKRDPKAPISLYINSPGGLVRSGLAIHDDLRGLRNPVHTFCLGQAAGMAAVLMAAGAKGFRMALPRAMFHLTPTEVSPDADPALRAQVDPLHDQVAGILARAVNRNVEEVRADMAVSTIMNAQEARRYGLIDEIVEALPEPSKPHK